MPRGSKPGERRGGREKNTPNKKTQEFLDLVAKHGVAPGELLARVVKGERIMALAYTNKETGEFVEHKVMPTLEQMIAADKELAQYTYPKRKAVEHSGFIGTQEDFVNGLSDPPPAKG